jgi:site-specific DNA recombinase
VLGKLLVAVGMAADELHLQLDGAALHRMLQLQPSQTDEPLELTTGVSKVREGKATRLVLTDATAAAPVRDRKLVALLAEARATRELLLAAPDRSIREIAAEQQRCRHRMAKLVRLSWMSPEIATAIVEGRQPRGLTARRLLEGELPLEWRAQEAAVGIE